MKCLLTSWFQLVLLVSEVTLDDSSHVKMPPNSDKILQHVPQSLGFPCFYRLLLRSSLYHLLSDEDRLTFELFEIQEP